ncbi:tyrosine-protein phosphatase [Levilactobacillus tujiorum]|uniref:tyrosine-protein phosphatase n=1 Tax=Levilactobacillus tujiorum TaxID=2912243 RepID=UPI00145634A7|nr:CpsB/CapC family capsule biosynthesis tyrosine phosphatase [Levilactobacillus tujiorum]NLR32865.1 tyrosine protein phosphatase [Levilactobacillus tujiorum]
MGLIDLHCHILPGVDDGSKDLGMSLTMVRVAVKQGISHILVTPHHMDGRYLNHKQDVIARTTTLQSAIDDAEIPLTVFPGQEVHLTGDLLKAVAADDILFMDEGNRYLLLELPHSGIPEYTENVIFELKLRNITPVIAHPERNHDIQRNPARLYDLVKMGCLTQLTSSSYLGVFGGDVERLTEKIIRSNLGFVLASDAHNFAGRRFLMAAAFDKLARQFGENMARQFNENAKAMINGENVAMPELREISAAKRRKFWLF